MIKVEAALSTSVRAAADMLANLLDEHSIVAGGAVRDLIRGDTARDIDIFVSPAGLPAAEGRVADQVDEDFAAVCAQLSDDGSGTEGWTSGLRDVFTYGKIQLCVVDDPVSQVREFDAWCNMVWLDHSGDIWAASPVAMEHIRAKVWEPRPVAGMTPSRAKVRRAKFAQRGWSVPRQDGTPGYTEPRTELHTILESF